MRVATPEKRSTQRGSSPPVRASSSFSSLVFGVAVVLVFPVVVGVLFPPVLPVPPLLVLPPVLPFPPLLVSVPTVNGTTPSRSPVVE